MAARKPVLRAVGPGEKPQRRRPLTLAQAIESGNYREILLAQRREIATSLPDEHGPAKAALHRHLSLISKELEALDAREADADGAGAVTPDDAWSAV